MREQNCHRGFVKLAYGSSASGVVAYQTDGRRHLATTTVETLRQRGRNEAFGDGVLERIPKENVRLGSQQRKMNVVIKSHDFSSQV
jgi:hypothetical protein